MSSWSHLLPLGFLLACAAAPSTASPDSGPKPLIVVSYPAIVTPAAESRLDGEYMKVRWPWKCSTMWLAGDDCERNPAALQETILKSLYYAPDVIKAAQSTFPEATVIGEPGIVDVGPNGAFTYRVPDSELPANVRIDFIARQNTRLDIGGEAYANTEGLYVVPGFIVSVCSAPYRCQLVAASEGLAKPLFSDTIQPSVLLHLIPAASPGKGDVKGIQIIETKTAKLTSEQWKHVTGDGSARFADALFTPYLSPLRPVLNLRSPLSASFNDAYGSLYLNDLAGEPDPLPTIAEFARAEASLLSTIGSNQLAALRRGDFGASIRKRMIAEREQNKKANRAAWLSAFTAGLAGFTAGVQGGSVGMAELAQLPAMQSQMSQMGTAFSDSFAPVTARQYSVAIRVGNAQQNLQVASVADLRQQFHALLASQRLTAQVNAGRTLVPYEPRKARSTNNRRR